MRDKKELYLGRKLEDLTFLANKQEEYKRFKKIEQLCRSGDHLFKYIFIDPLDEERTYIYIKRFLGLYHHMIRTVDDTRFVKLRFENNVNKALAHLQEIEQSLALRYKTLQEETDAAKSLVAAEGGQSVSRGPVFPVNQLFVTPKELVDAFKKEFHILVVDLRPCNDYKDCRLKDYENMNIPAEIIMTGLSAHRLGRVLHDQHFEKWDKRDTYDVVVLMDWETTPETYPGSRAWKLRTIMIEWDLNKMYNQEPVVLLGGFLDFSQCYPTLCITGTCLLNRTNTCLDELLDLDRIIYPTETPTDSSVEDSDASTSSLDPMSAENSPREYRSDILEEEKEVAIKKQKVEQELLDAEERWKKLHSAAVTEPQAKLMNEVSTLAKEIEELEKVQEELNLKKFELAQKYTLYASFQPGKDDEPMDCEKLKEIQDLESQSQKNYKILAEMAAERQRLLDHARAHKWKSTEKVPEPIPLAPEINRNTKPQYDSGKRLPLTEPIVKSKSNGLVGLKNIKNTCYMNTIIQCLRHIPDFIELFCSGTYATIITRQPDVIIRDFAFLVRQLWMFNGPSVIPDDFYKSVCAINMTYKAGNHEDCMEFFVMLFTQLSEDCASDITLNIFTPLQRSWFDALRGRSSYFATLFYHQLKVVQVCNDCKVKTIRYDVENTFMLSLPVEQSFTLDSLMMEYMKPDIIEDYVCSHCHVPVMNYKQFAVRPKVVVIVLKRYMQQCIGGQIIIKKNNGALIFPEDDFQLGACMYKLHAVALHTGTMTAGHYTAACLNPIDSNWYEFNDEIVRPIDIKSNIIKSKVCALFYVQTKKPYL